MGDKVRDLKLRLRQAKGTTPAPCTPADLRAVTESGAPVFHGMPALQRQQVVGFNEARSSAFESTLEGVVHGELECINHSRARAMIVPGPAGAARRRSHDQIAPGVSTAAKSRSTKSTKSTNTTTVPRGHAWTTGSGPAQTQPGSLPLYSKPCRTARFTLSHVLLSGVAFASFHSFRRRASSSSFQAS